MPGRQMLWPAVEYVLDVECPGFSLYSLVDNVAPGTNDLTKVATSILETKTELARVYSLPYLFRDEAHRFAQYYHHILRRKRVLGE